MSSFSSTRAGNTMSGRTYLSETVKVPNTYAWMELSVFNIPTSRSNLEATNLTVFYQTFANATESGEMKPLVEPFRIVIELFNAESPRACENFATLCKGFTPRTPTIYEDQAVDFCYKGTFFHKIIPKFFAQGGDLTRRVGGGGCNAYSVYGKQFNDENLRRSCDELGLVGFANNGPNTNGSQFFITTSEEDKEKALYGRHVIFGKVVEGLDLFMQHVAKAGSLDGQPKRHIVISDCGTM